MLVLVSVKGIDFREELFRLERVTLGRLVCFNEGWRLENYGGMLRYRGGVVYILYMYMLPPCMVSTKKKKKYGKEKICI